MLASGVGIWKCKTNNANFHPFPFTRIATQALFPENQTNKKQEEEKKNTCLLRNLAAVSVIITRALHNKRINNKLGGSAMVRGMRRFPSSAD